MKKNTTYEKIFTQLQQKVRPFFSQGKVADYVPALAQISATKFGAALSFPERNDIPLTIF